MEKVALSIREVTEVSGLGRTSIYAAMKSGDLKAVKYGARTLVLRGDLDAFLKRLPTARPRQ